MDITGTLGNDDGVDNPALIGTPDPDTINGLSLATIFLTDSPETMSPMAAPATTR
jgi:hypothetical protein